VVSLRLGVKAFDVLKRTLDEMLPGEAEITNPAAKNKFFPVPAYN
jgi:hypothetical protein